MHCAARFGRSLPSPARSLSFALIVATALLAASGAHAQPADPARREFDELFERVLRDPANVDLTLQYAATATRLGDYEAAITALERVLFFNPNLPVVRLELGVLYFRLGSFTVARTYLEQAKAGGLPPDEARRADQYIAETDRLASRHFYAGQFTLGFEHQSNANLAPAADAAVVFNGVTLPTSTVKKSDELLFASGSVLYQYDYQDQDRTVMELTGQILALKYARVHDFDLALAEVTAGPRSSFATLDLSGFSARPYVIANYASLGGDPFFKTLGFGLDVSQAVTPDLVVRGVYEHRMRDFDNSSSRTTSRLFSGQEDDVTLSANYLFTPDQVLTGSVGYGRQNLDAEFFSNDRFVFGAAYQITYRAPFSLTEGPWQTTLYGAREYGFYDAPDPSVDPGTLRRDRIWHFGLTQLVPIADGVGVLLQLQRDIASSTLGNYTYNNTTVLVGPQIRF
jgi:tetratricopeptide (TPR) repeat protein